MKTAIAVILILLTMVAAVKMTDIRIEFQVFVRFSTDERKVDYDSDTTAI